LIPLKVWYFERAVTNGDVWTYGGNTIDAVDDFIYLWTLSLYWLLYRNTKN